MSNNRIASIDGMRLIASFLVVCLHTPYIHDNFISACITDIARIAVPFFFIVSGFYIYNINKSTENQNIVKSIKKLSKVLIFTITFYIIIDIVVFRDMTKINDEFNNLFSYRLLIFNQIPFCPVAWYLLAYIYILLITYFVKNEILTSLMGISSIVFGLLTGTYSNFLGLKVDNFLFNCSFLSTYCFFIIGYTLNKYLSTNKIEIPQNKILVLIIITTLITAPLEHFALKLIFSTSIKGTTYISTYICSIFLFMFLIKNSSFLKQINFLGKKYSLEIYLYHVALHYILVSIFNPEKFNLSYKALINFSPTITSIVINNVTIFILLLTILYIKDYIKLQFNNESRT